MTRFTRAIWPLLLTLPGLFVSPRVHADEAPVEKPSTERPALPQSPAASPERRERHTNGRTYRTHRTRTVAPAARSGVGTRSFVYLAFGPGLVSGLGGGPDFQRNNLELGGLVGIELPLGARTGLGFELNGDWELAGNADRGSFSAVMLRARLAQSLGPRLRLWGGAGLGRAGYETGSLAFALAAGSSWMVTRSFGLDLSASLTFLEAEHGDAARPPPVLYDGGSVLVIAFRALFELHRGN